MRCGAAFEVVTAFPYPDQSARSGTLAPNFLRTGRGTVCHRQPGGRRMTVEPLAGYAVGITAERKREEFAAALERRGATVISAPAIRIVPLADDRELREATR